MFRILDRYIFREVLVTWLVVTSVLWFVLLTNQFARVLGQAAADRLPREAVFSMIWLTSVQYLTVLVPIALFLAIMLALARLYRDSEMVALMACGSGPRRLYRPILLLALLLVAAVGWLSLDVGPQAAVDASRMRDAAARELELGNFEAGRFVRAGSGSAVFYAEDETGNGQLSDVFIQRRDGDRLEIALAASGELRADGDRQMLILFDGRRYEGEPGKRNFSIIRFAEHGIPLMLPPAAQEVDDPELMPTTALIGSSDIARIAELQWRVSMPLSALLLALLAVPLSRTRPRQGRYGKMAVAILVYIAYSNLLGAARVWTERQVVPPEVGVWWVHGLLLLLTLVLLAKQTGALAGIRPRRVARAT
ncbi:MAG: LPS export ABC transporter permease LptF [Gammaproteobacteria bacterium]